MTVNGTDEAAAGVAVGMGIVFFIVLSIVGLLLYILPGIIASMRRHPQALPIWLVTIFLGGTGIGWVAALIWAFVTPERQTMVAMPMAMPPQPTPPQPYPPVAAPAPSASTAMTDEIAALARLRDQGVLTEAEFTARKRLLLGEEAAPHPPAAPAVEAPSPAPHPTPTVAAVAPHAPEAPHAPPPPAEAV